MRPLKFSVDLVAAMNLSLIFLFSTLELFMADLARGFLTCSSVICLITWTSPRYLAEVARLSVAVRLAVLCGLASWTVERAYFPTEASVGADGSA